MQSFSDRQLAKVFARISAGVGFALIYAGIEPIIVADLLKSVTDSIVKDNKELHDAVYALLTETTEEQKAEREGRAEPSFNRTVSDETASTARHENWD